MANLTRKNVHELTSLAAFNAFALTDAPALHVVYFWASWDEPSKRGGAMEQVIDTLAELHPTVHFAKVRPGSGSFDAIARAMHSVLIFSTFSGFRCSSSAGRD